MNIFEVIAMVSIFIILLVVLFKPIKSAFNLDTFPSCVLSVCVSALCIIGMSCSMEGITGAVLLPYAALGITLLLLTFISFIWNGFEKGKKYLNKRKERSYGQLDKKERSGVNNRNIRKQPDKRKGYLR